MILGVDIRRSHLDWQQIRLDILILFKAEMTKVLSLKQGQDQIRLIYATTVIWIRLGWRISEAIIRIARLPGLRIFGSRIRFRLRMRLSAPACFVLLRIKCISEHTLDLIHLQNYVH